MDGQPQYLVGGDWLRYAVNYNGVLTLQDVQLSSAWAAKKSVTYMDSTGHYATRGAIPVTINATEIDNWSTSGAHFDEVQMELDGQVSGVIDAVEMSGQKLSVAISVADGQKYVYYRNDPEGKNSGFVEATETVTGVTLMFRNQLIGEIHGTYVWDKNAKDPEDNTLKWNAMTQTASFNIPKFSPDNPVKYTYGDVLMAVLTTDKIVGSSKSTTYDPVSTGFCVIADLNYKPETFDVSFDNLAETMGVTDPGDDPGNAKLKEETKEYSFGRFPYDDSPQAVYDPRSGDYSVFYYKTYQTDSAYDDNTQFQKLIDMSGINTDPSKTYSFLCYISLNVTRFDAVGSVEATRVVLSDDTPVAGQTVEVDAAIENTGLTTAQGCTVEVYQAREGQKYGQPIAHLDYNKPIPVNSAIRCSFNWTVPQDGPEGCQLAFVVAERNAQGYYPPSEWNTGSLTTGVEYDLYLSPVEQVGDQFHYSYRVTNVGNLAVPENTSAQVRASTLYGDPQEVYGLDTDVFQTIDISGMQPGETREGENLVTLPAKLFSYSGNDAFRLQVWSEDLFQAESDEVFVTMEQPINVTVNDGSPLNLRAGETGAVKTYCDATPFLERNLSVVYSVENPGVAAVDSSGQVTALSGGSTILTATLLPSGKTAQIQVNVMEDAAADSDDSGDSGDFGGSSSSPISGSSSDSSAPAQAPAAGQETQTAALLAPYGDLDQDAWYSQGIAWALEKGVMNGVGNDLFAPDSDTSRAMIVTMLYRLEGQPPVSGELTFTDVEEGQWYADAVAWAVANGIVTGYDPSTFGPNDSVTREQLAVILYRYVQSKGLGYTGAWMFPLDYADAADVADWASEAMHWMVQHRIINGLGDGTLAPDGSASRAQVATILMRSDAVEREN